VRLWNDPARVKFTPIVTTGLLEAANLNQLIRMWGEHSARGQSLQGWVCVGLALALWWNWYRVMVPGDRFARRCTAFGILMNALVVLSVIWFRYLAHGAPL
jgi:hypothetical protein